MSKLIFLKFSACYRNNSSRTLHYAVIYASDIGLAVVIANLFPRFFSNFINIWKIFFILYPLEVKKPGPNNEVKKSAKNVRNFLSAKNVRK